MVSRFARRVARGIRSRGLWRPADRIAVAVSGGADSVALALVLAELAVHADWALAGLIHVNHALRGEDSARDEAFCRTLAAELRLPVDVVTVDVTHYRTHRRVSLEVAARELRYAAFEEAAPRLSASVVATAHTLDDQAETVLLRLLRGASARGASAIRARRGMFARPLLDERRADVVAYLASRGQAYREDLSNRDTSIPRNRLRHRLLPVVDEVWPGGIEGLARFARLAADDEAYLARAVARIRPRLVQSGERGVELERGALGRLPRAIARRLVRDVIEQAGGRPSAAKVEAVLRLSQSDKQNGHLDLQNAVVEMTSTSVAIRCAPSGAVVPPARFNYSLAVPGTAGVSETGSVFEASLSCEAETSAPLRSAGPVAVLQADRLALPLTVRSRRTGDRMRPLGAPGTRRVQDLLVDRKVPLAERDRVPIVEDRDGQIVWVAGVAVAEGVRVTRPEAGVVILKIKKDRA